MARSSRLSLRDLILPFPIILIGSKGALIGAAILPLKSKPYQTQTESFFQLSADLTWGVALDVQRDTFPYNERSFQEDRAAGLKTLR